MIEQIKEAIRRQNESRRKREAEDDRREVERQINVTIKDSVMYIVESGVGVVQIDERSSVKSVIERVSTMRETSIRFKG